MEKEDTRKNVLHVLTNDKRAHKKHEALATQIKVHPSTVNRWFSGETHPQKRHLAEIERQFGVPIHALQQPHGTFLKEYQLANHSMESEYRNTKPSVSFGAISKWRWSWSETAKKYVGQYLIYSIITGEGGIAKGYAVSLLHIEKETKAGITFTITNIDTRHGQKKHYDYQGLLFPIHDCLALYCEEKSGDELMTILVDKPQAEPSLLIGYLLAVGVAPGIRKIGTSKIVLERLAKRTISPSDLFEKLGIFPAEKTPIHVRSLLEN